tara:strand:+ start:63 stop:782 length:720 start_codon:yes stop_codon:yes gene_type:complete
MSKHKHHIIPKYKCKELGIDPDFPENIVEVTRLDHALIHWGYKCDDLEPLFKYVRPSQEIIDLIPRGDDRDVGAAVILAEGEIDGIVPVRGNDHPDYIPVLDLDGNEVEGSEDWPDTKRYYYRRCVSKGKQPKTHEERAIIRKEKELVYRERKKIREEKKVELLKVAHENNKTIEAVKSLEWYRTQRKKGIDPAKKYRETHREENKVYARWYYYNVQKPKNTKKKLERQGVGTLEGFLK